MRKGYINQWNKKRDDNNMKMKNIENKMDKRSIAYIVRGNKT